MKKFYVPVIALMFFTVLSVMVSCKKNSFLGATSTTNLSQQVIFTDSAYTEGFLSNIYASMGFATSPSRFSFVTPSGSVIPCGGLDAAGDESDVSHLYSTSALEFAIGAINQADVATTSTAGDAYSTCYTQIRAVNQLLANIKSSPLQASTQVQRKAEARFLRAWYYAILLEHYGGVPIVGNTLYTYTQPIPTRRSSFATTVNYIISELDSVQNILPLTQAGPGLGRASGGACLALKARVLLYAASPLFNIPPGATNTPASLATTVTVTDVNGKKIQVNQDTLVAYPDYQVSRWQLAKNAAYAVINTGAYQLFNTSYTLPGYGVEGPFQYMFTLRTNIESILQLDDNGGEDSAPAANYLESLFNPPSRTGANGAFPYEGTVEAFTMANGKAITDPTSGYDPTHPYANRDPRLTYSIVYDQALLGNRSPTGQINGSYSPVNIYLVVSNGVKSGGPDAIYQGTTTGYYNNKMVDPDACSECGLGQPTARTLPLMRYAEILLDYAEAYNETITQDSAYYEIEQLRKRAGIAAGTDGLYGLQAGMTQAEMRTAIQNERHVELAYEGNRFFDVRRWLIAEQTENFEGQGMEVDHIGTDTTYTIVPVTKHLFTPKMYLWPFPQLEIGKGGGLVQNPGY